MASGFLECAPFPASAVAKAQPKLDANRADYFAVVVFDDLKLGQAFFQLFRRQTHRRPNGIERGAVVHRGAADAERLRRHELLRGCICNFKTMWQLLRKN